MKKGLKWPIGNPGVCFSYVPDPSEESPTGLSTLLGISPSNTGKLNKERDAMKVNVWTVFGDDDRGPRTTVHMTEKAAYEQWMKWQFPDDSDEEDRANREVAAAFIDCENYEGLCEWKENRHFGEPFDSYFIEGHEIDIANELKG